MSGQKDIRGALVYRSRNMGVATTVHAFPLHSQKKDGSQHDLCNPSIHHLSPQTHPQPIIEFEHFILSCLLIEYLVEDARPVQLDEQCIGWGEMTMALRNGLRIGRGQ